MEKLRTDWTRALDDGERKKIAEQIQLEAVKLVPIVPLGQFTVPGALASLPLFATPPAWHNGAGNEGEQAWRP